MNEKYSLSVGINYKGTQSELSGCLNDAHGWSELLAHEGYDASGLTERGATKAAILGELDHLVGKAKFGDRIVFTFSGHGTWVPDRDGDEADRRDEALCPIDYASGGLITDDELQAVFGRMRYGVGALILSDSCHSGTVSRLGALTGTPGPGAPRFIPPHTFLDISQERAVELEAKPASAPRRTASLISGCADLEYSYDAWFGDVPFGAFSRAAFDSFRSGITLKGWFNEIRDKLPNGPGYPYPQTPQLTASSHYRKYRSAL